MDNAPLPNVTWTPADGPPFMRPLMEPTDAEWKVAWEFAWRSKLDTIQKALIAFDIAHAMKDVRLTERDSVLRMQNGDPKHAILMRVTKALITELTIRSFDGDDVYSVREVYGPNAVGISEVSFNTTRDGKMSRLEERAEKGEAMQGALFTAMAHEPKGGEHETDAVATPDATEERRRTREAEKHRRDDQIHLDQIDGPETCDPT